MSLRLLFKQFNLLPICFDGFLVGIILISLVITIGLFPVAYADDYEATGTYTITDVTQYSSDFGVSVQSLTDGNYFALYRNGIVIGTIVPITGKVRSMPQMFSDPAKLEVRFLSDSAGVTQVGTAHVTTPNVLVFSSNDIILNPSGNWLVTDITQFSSDFEITVQNLTNGNYFALYRKGTIIGTITPITDKVRSIPQMFSDPSILEVRFYSNSNGSGLVATATLSSTNELIIDELSFDNCFIATAAFGSKFEPAVVLLRQFRDSCLLSNSLGQIFVNFYYTNSPPIAEVIADSSFLKTIARLLLIPLIIFAYFCLHPIWILVLITLGILRRAIIMRINKNLGKWVMPIIILVLLIFPNISISNAATINDVENNSLRIGYDIYSLNSDNLTDENIILSLTDLNQVYFKIGNHWYDVFATESDAELGDPENALSSDAVNSWTGLETWYKAGSEVSYLTNISELPTSPSDLTAIPASNSQINLSWTAVTGASSYNVYRSGAQEGSYSKLATSNTNNYIEYGLSASTSYWYKVSAVNSAGEGNQSLSVNGTTLASVESFISSARAYYDNEQYDEAIAECNKAFLIDTTNVDIYMLRGTSYFHLDSYANAMADFDSALLIDPNISEAYLYKGRCYLESEQYSNAVSEFNSSLQLEPTLADGYKGRGISYAYLGQPESALQDFSLLIQYAPNDADAYFLRANTYCELDNYEASIADYCQSIILNPQYAITYNNKGVAYQLSGEYQAAVDEYTIAVQLNPTYYTFNNLGVAYHFLGQYENAIDAYNQAISIEPQYAPSYSNRGKSYASKGQDDEALSSWAQAIALDPEFEPTYNCRGWYYYYSDQEGLAVADFSKAIQIGSENSEGESFGPWDFYNINISAGMVGAYEGRGWSYYYLDQLIAAISDFTEWISIDPDNPYAYESRGYVYRDLGKYSEAIADSTKSIELDPSYYYVYGIRGWSYIGLEEYNSAIADFNSSISLNPDYNGGYEGRAKCYYWLGNYDLAVIDFTKCISFYPNDDYYYDWRGYCYYWFGQYDLAATDFTKCISLDPNNDYYYFSRGRCYYELGQYSLAVTDFTKCISLDPSNGDYYDWRGYCYYWNDQYYPAITDFTKCISLDSTYDYYYGMRGWCYFALGQYAYAEADFRQCLALNPDNIDAQEGLAALGYSSYSIQSCDSTPRRAHDANIMPNHLSSPAEYDSTPTIKPKFIIQH